MSSSKQPTQWSNQCKLCKLMRTDRELFEEIHIKVIHEQSSHVAVRRWLNSQIELRNVDKDEDLKLPPFSDQNFSLHFKKHGGAWLNEKYIARRSNGNNRLDQARGATEEEVEYLKDFAETLNAEFTEYSALSKMIDSLEQRLWSYDRYLDARDKEHPDRKPNFVEIGNYQKQVESLMKLKTDLSKLRNSSTVAGSAIQSAVHYAVGAFLEIMMDSTEESLNILATEFPRSSVPLEAIKVIRNKIAETMKGVIPGVIAKVEGEFKIK